MPVVAKVEMILRNKMSLVKEKELGLIWKASSTQGATSLWGHLFGPRLNSEATAQPRGCGVSCSQAQEVGGDQLNVLKVSLYVYFIVFILH